MKMSNQRQTFRYLGEMTTAEVEKQPTVTQTGCPTSLTQVNMTLHIYGPKDCTER